MDNITDVRIEPLTSSRFIRPKRIHYKQNGVEKIWDAMKTHDAVAILLFNSSRNVFVLVKQFRPALYIHGAETDLADGLGSIDTTKYPGSRGVTLEYCAGIIDKAGTSGSHIHLFFAEVTDEMKVGPGGGLVAEGELIEVVDVPVEEGRKLIYDESVNRTGGLMFGLLWFFNNKWKNNS